MTDETQRWLYLLEQDFGGNSQVKSEEFGFGGTSEEQAYYSFILRMYQYVHGALKIEDEFSPTGSIAVKCVQYPDRMLNSKRYPPICKINDVVREYIHNNRPTLMID